MIGRPICQWPWAYSSIRNKMCSWACLSIRKKLCPDVHPRIYSSDSGLSFALHPDPRRCCEHSELPYFRRGSSTLWRVHKVSEAANVNDKDYTIDTRTGRNTNVLTSWAFDLCTRSYALHQCLVAKWVVSIAHDDIVFIESSLENSRSHRLDSWLESQSVNDHEQDASRWVV